MTEEGPRPSQVDFSQEKSSEMLMSMFQTSPPTDVLTGAMSGLRLVLAEAVIATTLMVAAPVKCTMDGYQSYGVIGGKYIFLIANRLLIP